MNSHEGVPTQVEVKESIKPVNNIVGITLFRHAERSKNTTGSDQSLPENKSPVGEYFDLTPEGIEETARQAEDYARQVIDKLPGGTVTLAVGATDMFRTNGTLNVLVDTFEKIYQTGDSVAVLTQEEIFKQLNDPDYIKNSQERWKSGRLNYKYITTAGTDKIKKTLNIIKEFIEENKDKKAVIGFPIWMKGLTYGRHWGYWSSLGLLNATPDQYMYEYYAQKGLDHEESELEMFQEWLKYGEGKSSLLPKEYAEWAIEKLKHALKKDVKDGEKTAFENDLAKLENGDVSDLLVAPDDIFDDYMKSSNRIADFASRRLGIGERPLNIIADTHRLDIDAWKQKIETRDKKTGGDMTQGYFKDNIKELVNKSGWVHTSFSDE